MLLPCRFRRKTAGLFVALAVLSCKKKLQKVQWYVDLNRKWESEFKVKSRLKFRFGTKLVTCSCEIFGYLNGKILMMSFSSCQTETRKRT